MAWSSYGVLSPRCSYIGDRTCKGGGEEIAEVVGWIRLGHGRPGPRPEPLSHPERQRGGSAGS
jgi:hypothetical protein